MIEQELKYQLSKNNFYLIKEYFLDNFEQFNEFEQINYYFDSTDFCLKNQGIISRIRKINNNKYEFTIKHKLKGEKKCNIHIKNEDTIYLNKSCALNIIESKNFKNYPYLFKNISNLYDGNLNIEDLILLGELKTIRNLYSKNNGNEEICLDQSYYFDQIDYEIEWETTDINKANIELLTIFENLNITPIDNYDSKTTRFIKRLCTVN